MRNAQALIFGIDDYEWAPLKGCVNDAQSLERVLTKNADGSPNFHCHVHTSDKKQINTDFINKMSIKFFEREADIMLFYFSGHGEQVYGGYLVSQNATKYNLGIPLSSILHYANSAIDTGRVKEIVIILDCCFSGNMGDLTHLGDQMSLLKKGMSILTASNTHETAVERQGHGLFTSIICEALQGGAADVTGDITVASVYNYAEKILGFWSQRPIFKTYTSRMISLRRSEPKVPIEILHNITTYFVELDDEFPLSPAYEPDAEPKCIKKEKVFGNLQKLVSAGLVEPVGEQYMYYAAMRSKACRLTKLGRFYWRMIDNNKL
ncbi:MAG: caspase family protein [Bacteroidota bacterium]